MFSCSIKNICFSDLCKSHNVLTAVMPPPFSKPHVYTFPAA